MIAMSFSFSISEVALRVLAYGHVEAIGKRLRHRILERSVREEAEGRGKSVIDAKERRSHIGRD
jgi:hypothetical protein